MENTTISLKKERETSRKKKEIGSIVILSIMLIISPVLSLFIARDITPGLLVYLLTMIALYSFPLAFLKLKTYYKAMFWVLPFNLVDIVHLVMYKHTTTLLWVYTTLIAEGGELFELIRVYWPIISLVALSYVAYLYINHRYVRKIYVAGPKVRLWLGIVAGAWMLLAGTLGIVADRTNRCTSFLAMQKVPPFNIAVQSLRLVHYQLDIDKGFRETNDYRFGATTSAPEDEMVIMIMGESSRYNNWQINGYDRVTSPRLAERQDQIIRFDSVYSAANITTVSVPMILSRATPTTLSTYTQETSFIDAMHEAGYKTAWIADQSFRNSFLLNVSGKCDYIYYIDHSNFKFHDENLLEPLWEHISQSDDRQFVFLHTLGGHFKYNSRYPQEYSVFRPDLNDVNWEELRHHFDIGLRNMDAGNSFSAAANVVKTILTNSYDNTVLYTDMIVDSVIRLAEQTERPTVIVYMADHGENLLDDAEHRMLHGQVSTSLYEFHVPMFIWASEEWKERHPEMIAALLANKHKRMSTMNLFHTILSLGQVTIPQADLQKSAASDHFVADTTTWILDSDLRPTLLEVH